MSSEEVRVKVVESPRTETRYWNLRKFYPERGEMVEMSRGQRNGEKRNEEEKENRGREHEDSIHIDFNMSETRQISDEQKQSILRTMIGEESSSISFSRMIPGAGGLIGFLALLAFFALLSAMWGYPYY